jgi:hypothetical protein
MGSSSFRLHGYTWRPRITASVDMAPDSIQDLNPKFLRYETPVSNKHMFCDCLELIVVP